MSRQLLTPHGARKYAWWVLIYTVAVIVWGAYVRASGSGAGCGDHWPLCNGEVIPRAPSIGRMIEFSHRLTSGLSLIFVAGLFYLIRRVFPPSHPARFAALMGFVFIIGEALVGAALVILQLVADNDSVLRAVVIAAHLVNTFLLLYWLSKVVYLAHPKVTVSQPNNRTLKILFLICLTGFVMTGAIGAVVALGDTLFPAQSLTQALVEEVSPAAHFLIKLRIWHPLIAVMSTVYILVLCVIIPRFFRGQTPATFSFMVGGLILLQFAGGILNWLLLAPTHMQLVHLALADLTWITICFWYFSATTSSGELR